MAVAPVAGNAFDLDHVAICALAFSVSVTSTGNLVNSVSLLRQVSQGQNKPQR